MAKEVVLDIGIGEGGTYLDVVQDNDELHIGLDTTLWTMRVLTEVYQQVPPVQATAANLPFPNQTIDRITVMLPSGNLAVPGLQAYHEAYVANDSQRNGSHLAQGFYPELSRVLKKDGTITIVGDYWVDPDAIRNQADMYFTPVQIRRLSPDEFMAYGTPSTVLSRDNADDSYCAETWTKPWDQTLFCLTLENKNVFNSTAR